MRVLIDTNILLDVLLNRALFVQDAVDVLNISDKDVKKYVSATTITDIYYIAYKELRDKEIVRDLIKRLLKIVHIADVSEQEIILAIDSGWDDFEDSVQNAVAESHKFDAIITRNISDFKESSILIISPKDFVGSFNNKNL